MGDRLLKPAIYLASGSPRRAALLDQIGIPFTLISTNVNEAPQADEDPSHYVQRLARAKAIAAVTWYQQQHWPPRLLLAADTCVALGQQLFTKPDDASHATRMLQQLSATTHQVFSAIAVTDAQSLRTALSCNEVRFKALDQGTIDAYVATGEPLDKAGAYALQGIGATLVAHLSGSFSGVVGLPLMETVSLLGDFGYPFWPS